MPNTEEFVGDGIEQWYICNNHDTKPAVSTTPSTMHVMVQGTMLSLPES